MGEESWQSNRFQAGPSGSQNPIKGGSVYMETAAMVCGIASIVCCTCIYFSLIFGALAIIFGLLSRGGERHINDRAIVGTALGGTGLGFTILIYLVSAIVLVYAYGGLSGWVDAYSGMSDMTTLEIYDDLYDHLESLLMNLYA